MEAANPNSSQEIRKRKATSICRPTDLERNDSPLTRIGVTQEQVDKASPITAILKDLRHGVAKAIRAMRFSDSPDVITFLAKYDSLSEHDRVKVPIEAVAIASGIDPRVLLGEIMVAMREHSVNMVKLIAVAEHPDVIKKQVQFAKTPAGTRDRESLNIMLGAMPSPKSGSTFINKVFANGAREPDAPVAEAQVVEEMVDNMDYVFPDASAIQERIRPLRQRLLERK